MKTLLVIPVYNDAYSALRLISVAVKEIDEVLIIDESDHETAYPASVTVLRRKRRGKWAIWRDAFGYANKHNCDVLTEIDADVKADSFRPLLNEAGNGADFVTARTQFANDGDDWFGSRTAHLYDAYEDLLERSKIPKVAGQVLVFGKRALRYGEETGLISRPCPLDDFVVGSMMLHGGMVHSCIPFGIMKTPGTFGEYVKYRARHNNRAKIEALGYIKQYHGYEAYKFARDLLKQYRRVFMKAVLSRVSFLPVSFAFPASFLTKADPVRWQRLPTEKWAT